MEEIEIIKKAEEDPFSTALESAGVEPSLKKKYRDIKEEEVSTLNPEEELIQLLHDSGQVEEEVSTGTLTTENLKNQIDRMVAQDKPLSPNQKNKLHRRRDGLKTEIDRYTDVGENTPPEIMREYNKINQKLKRHRKNVKSKRDTGFTGLNIREMSPEDKQRMIDYQLSKINEQKENIYNTNDVAIDQKVDEILAANPNRNTEEVVNEIVTTYLPGEIRQREKDLLQGKLPHGDGDEEFEHEYDIDELGGTSDTEDEIITDKTPAKTDEGFETPKESEGQFSDEEQGYEGEGMFQQRGQESEIGERGQGYEGESLFETEPGEESLDVGPEISEKAKKRREEALNKLTSDINLVEIFAKFKNRRHGIKTAAEITPEALSGGDEEIKVSPRHESEDLAQARDEGKKLMVKSIIKTYTDLEPHELDQHIFKENLDLFEEQAYNNLHIVMPSEERQFLQNLMANEVTQTAFEDGVFIAIDTFTHPESNPEELENLDESSSHFFEKTKTYFKGWYEDIKESSREDKPPEIVEIEKEFAKNYQLQQERG